VAYRWAFLTARDKQLVNGAKTAAQCLTLADKKLALGYWRLSLLRSGAVKTLRPPVSADWGVATAALRRGEMLVATSKREDPVPAGVRAALISRAAIFLLHVSAPGDMQVLHRTLAALRRAHGVAPKSTEILSELSFCYDQLASAHGVASGEARAALAKGESYARAAIKLDPRCTEAYWNLAGAEVIARNYAAAINLRLRALALTRYSDPAYDVYDYHAINFWTRAMAKYIKAVRPKAYAHIRGQIAYFSPGGVPYSDSGRVLAREISRKRDVGRGWAAAIQELPAK
jgi:tetratricopeptide (TPR) repeat protein